MKTKKANIAILGTVLLTLAGMLVAWQFGAEISDWMRGGGDIETCRSTFLASSSKLSQVKNIALNCIAPHHKFKSEDRELYYDIANDMKSCWFKTAEGNKEIKAFAELGRDGEGCIVCSTFESKNEIQTNEIIDYLGNNMPGSQKSYLDYFNMFGWDIQDADSWFDPFLFVKTYTTDLGFPGLLPADAIEAERKYAIIYSERNLIGGSGNSGFGSSIWLTPMIVQFIIHNDLIDADLLQRAGATPSETILNMYKRPSPNFNIYRPELTSKLAEDEGNTKHMFVIPSDEIAHAECDNLYWKKE